MEAIIRRSADGVAGGVFPYPIWAGSGGIYNPEDSGRGVLYQHEVGWDAVYGRPLALPASITTCNITTAIGGADSNVRMTRIEPDMRQTGPVTVTRLARPYARSKDIYKSEVCHPDTKKLDDLRGQGRLLQLTFATNELGGSFEFGKHLIHVEPGDARPVDSE